MSGCVSPVLWAEILGHFPWEFERMIAKTIELEVGVASTSTG